MPRIRCDTNMISQISSAMKIDNKISVKVRKLVGPQGIQGVQGIQGPKGDIGEIPDLPVVLNEDMNAMLATVIRNVPCAYLPQLFYNTETNEVFFDDKIPSYFELLETIETLKQNISDLSETINVMKSDINELKSHHV